MQDEMARWTEAMAQRKQSARQPGEMLSALIVALADQRSRALPALDADERDLLLAEVRDALHGRYR